MTKPQKSNTKIGNPSIRLKPVNNTNIGNPILCLKLVIVCMTFADLTLGLLGKLPAVLVHVRQTFYFFQFHFVRADIIQREGVAQRSASDFMSEDPGFDPLAGQGEEQFFYPSESSLVLSLSVISCADLFVPDPPSCVRHGHKFVRMLKIPYPSVVTE